MRILPLLTERPTSLLAAAATLLLLAAQGPTTIEDDCDGGSVRNIADICALIVDPTTTSDDGEAALEAVTFTMVVAGDTSDWAPGDMWDIMWRIGDCTWALRWFHDPGSDLPGELSTHLDRTCDGVLHGFEIDPPTLDGSTLSTTVSIEDLQELDSEVGLGATLASVKAHTYLGAGWQWPAIFEYGQVSRESDTTTPTDVVLE